MHSVSKIKNFLTPEKVFSRKEHQIQVIMKSDTVDGKGSKFFFGEQKVSQR